MGSLFYKLHTFPKHNFYSYIIALSNRSLFYFFYYVLIFHENSSDFFINTNYAPVDMATLKSVHISHYFQR